MWSFLFGTHYIVVELRLNESFADMHQHQACAQTVRYYEYSTDHLFVKDSVFSKFGDQNFYRLDGTVYGTVPSWHCPVQQWPQKGLSVPNTSHFCLQHTPLTR